MYDPATFSSTVHPEGARFCVFTLVPEFTGLAWCTSLGLGLLWLTTDPSLGSGFPETLGPEVCWLD